MRGVGEGGATAPDANIVWRVCVGWSKAYGACSSKRVHKNDRSSSSSKTKVLYYYYCQVCPSIRTASAQPLHGPRLTLHARATRPVPAAARAASLVHVAGGFATLPAVPVHPPHWAAATGLQAQRPATGLQHHGKRSIGRLQTNGQSCTHGQTVPQVPNAAAWPGQRQRRDADPALLHRHVYCIIYMSVLQRCPQDPHTTGRHTLDNIPRVLLHAMCIGSNTGEQPGELCTLR